MAYNLRYFTSFYGTADKRTVADPDLFEMRILELDGVDAPEELEASEFPAVINYQNSSDNKLLPLRGSWLDLNLLATENFQLENLYTENERNWLVQVDRNGDRIGNWFIIPDGCQEQFYFPPYVVTVNAVDGLGLLKNLSFVQNTGDIWVGKMTWIEVIYACLNRVGIPDMDIYTCVNIYPTGVTQGDAIDPLGITYINSERYFKDDGVTPMNCQEVLESVLQEWTACIIQSEGHWWIYRPTEAALSGTLVFRHYVDGIYQGILSKNIDVLLGGESEGIILAPLYHINADQLKMIEKPFKTASISYRYGVNPSVLDNPNLAGAFTEGAGDPVGPRDDVVIPGWTRNGTIYTGLNPGGGVIFYKVSGFSDANYYQNDQSVTIAQGRVLRLDISYESIPAMTATDMTFGVELYDGLSTYYLQPRQDGVYSWDNELPYFKWTSLRSNQGVSNGQIIAEPTPRSGIITFKIYPPDSPSGDIIYFKIDATEQRQDGDPVGEIHTTQQDADYTFAAETINVFNGDDPSDFFLGTIFLEDQDTPTTKWVRRGLSESILANPPEADKQFLRIAVEEINRLYGAPFVKFEGSIQNYFNPLSRFTINLLEGKFMPVSLSYDLQANICKSVLTRVSNTEIAMDYTVEPDYGETTKVTVK